MTSRTAYRSTAREPPGLRATEESRKADSESSTESSDVRELIVDNATRVYRFALRLSGDPNDAEDLTQETMLRAWRRKARLRKPESARAWLFRITVNLWRDQLRRGRRSREQSDGATEHVSRDRSSEESLERNEELGHVLSLVDKLLPRQREVLYLHAFEELSQKEIARVLNVSRSAVKSSLSASRMSETRAS